MISAEKIIVALDASNGVEAKKIMAALKGIPVWMKVGMELFYAEGPSLLYAARDEGFKVFLDLKLHDIPHTVGQAMKSLSKLPMDMVNVHAAGGSEMMKNALESLRSSPHTPLLIAVTQLTSTSSSQMNFEQRIPGDIVESVVHYAKLAKEAGLDGVVSSPQEVQAIKLVCGQHFLTVTPGIRPASADQQDQKRIATPLEALRLGTDFMVIGRPITQAPKPRAALEQILKGEA